MRRDATRRQLGCQDPGRATVGRRRSHRLLRHSTLRPPTRRVRAAGSSSPTRRAGPPGSESRYADRTAQSRTSTSSKIDLAPANTTTDPATRTSGHPGPGTARRPTRRDLRLRSQPPISSCHPPPESAEIPAESNRAMLTSSAVMSITNDLALSPHDRRSASQPPRESATSNATRTRPHTVSAETRHPTPNGTPTPAHRSTCCES